MSQTFKPTSAEQTAELLTWAAGEEAPLEVIGTGSKRGLGRPIQTANGLDLSDLKGITLYEPAELVMTAGAGTPLSEIRAALAENRQELAFEPGDLGPLFGGPAGGGTIGGLVACNLAGPRRIKAGAARDHLLGFTAVSGRGEVFKSGGRVVKNVTGYDLSKLVTGSFGTLAALTEVTLKVLPAAEKARTLLLFGLYDRAAVAAMSRALSSAHEISGAAHLPPDIAKGSGVSYIAGAGGAVTALRLEGHGPSVEARLEALRSELKDLGQSEELHSTNTAALWREIADVTYLVEPADRVVWKVSVAPTHGPEVVAAITARVEARYLLDWGGGLILLSMPAGEGGWADELRGAVAKVGGHATLLRAPEALRRQISVFHPQPEPLAALTARVKDSFDPRRILNPGRMYSGV
jgi:glycolate oxidase FAD binding subunit